MTDSFAPIDLNPVEYDPDYEWDRFGQYRIYSDEVYETIMQRALDEWDRPGVESDYQPNNL